jgi:hypothetical protein
MAKQIRLRLDGQDIKDLAAGGVLYKEETGQSRGTGSTFTAGQNPVEIVLNGPDQQMLQSLLGVKTSGGHTVQGAWPPCPKCTASGGFSSQTVPGNPPVVEITCDACLTVVATLPFLIP